MLDYGIVGNCKTAALIKKNCSINWFCFPTFSDPSIFAKILDEKKGGSLEIIPKGKYRITQRYILHTAILETIFESNKNSFKVVDFFPRYRKLLRRKQETLIKQNRLIRIITPIKGRPVVRILYDPRPNYARETCSFQEIDGSLVCSASKGSEFGLISNVPYTDILESREVELTQTKYLIVGSCGNAADFSVRTCQHLYAATKRYWERFVKELNLPEQNRDHIIRSAITLKLMTYSETGAIIAAPTTSIPEQIGTSRTWDYRYCWVRDATLAADALKRIGRGYEAKKLMGFIIANALRDDYIQIMYGIHGETRLREEELHHLAGFRDSRPVRIGNAAYKQLQHDIFGEILDLIYLYFVYYEIEKKLTHKYWRFIRYLVNQIKFSWERKDSSIWEFRDRYDHYTYSKFMCYLGLDRAVRLAQHFHREQDLKEWLELREEVRNDLLSKGYSEEKKSFTMTYGGKDLDASLLRMACNEFLEANDPRIVSTVRAVERELRNGSAVRRYSIEDEFGKSTSAFTICSFWLVEALFYIGEVQKARTLYDTLLRRANHLGLFSEDTDLQTGKLLGNFPQAYTHIALINSSLLLSEWGSKQKKYDVRKEKWI